MCIQNLLKMTYTLKLNIKTLLSKFEAWQTSNTLITIYSKTLFLVQAARFPSSM